MLLPTGTWTSIANTNTALIQQIDLVTASFPANVLSMADSVPFTYQIWVFNSAASSGFVGYAQNADADISSTIPVEGKNLKKYKNLETP